MKYRTLLEQKYGVSSDCGHPMMDIILTRMFVITVNTKYISVCHANTDPVFFAKGDL